MATSTPLSAVNLKLIERLRQLTGDPLDLSPWVIAALLDDCANALKSYVTIANSEVGIESEAFVPAHVIEQVGSVFKELSDNFFPMAHTDRPLRELQIVNTAELRHINGEWEDLSRGMMAKTEYLHAQANEHLESSHQMMAEIERLRARLDQIIHP